MTSNEILGNAFVVSGSGVRLSQFRRCLDAVGLNGSLPREWKSCHIEGDGSMGNAVSQYSIVRYALEAKMPFVVIFEDDAVPCDNAAEGLVKAFENRKDGTLCLSLGWTYSSDGKEDRGDNRRVYGSHAYALFGEKAYLAYMKAWEKNGYADIVLGLCEGSKMNEENLFAQHSPDGWGIHCPPGWGVNAEMVDIEKAVDVELWDKYRKSKVAIKKMDLEREMHVVYTVDVQGNGALQFIDQLVVSVYSLKESMSPSDRVCVHILYNNIPSSLVFRLQAMAMDRFRVEFKKIPESDATYMQSLSKSDPRSEIRVWSGIVYARIWIPLAFPNLKRAIYLDADTLVQKSLKPLWELDMEGNFFGMAPPDIPEYGYNSGVMLLDCEAMRKETELWQRLGAFMEQEAKTYYLPDQTAINRFFAGKIKVIDKSWNWPPRPAKQDAKMKEAAVIHYYVSKKPVRFDDDMTSKVMWNAVLAKAEEEAAKCL